MLMGLGGTSRYARLGDGRRTTVAAIGEGATSRRGTSTIAVTWTGLNLTLRRDLHSGACVDLPSIRLERENASPPLSAAVHAASSPARFDRQPCVHACTVCVEFGHILDVHQCPRPCACMSARVLAHLLVREDSVEVCRALSLVFHVSHRQGLA